MPLLDAFLGPPGQAVLSQEVELVGLDVVGGLLADPGPLLRRELRLERGRDLQRDVGLDGEDVGQLAVVGLGPEVPVRLGVDELGRRCAPGCPARRTLPSSRVATSSAGPDLAQALLPLLERASPSCARSP